MANGTASLKARQEDEFLQRAYTLSGVNAAQDLYNEWSQSYENDMLALAYSSPRCAADTVVENIGKVTGNLRILDAGCGTGLVGLCLSKSTLSGQFVIDGLDLSEGMLESARKKDIYRDLEIADLSEPIKRKDESYDVVICVGTLTKGHVGPKVLSEFARVTANGGLIVATVHDEIWESGGYKEQVEAMISIKSVVVVSMNEFGLMEGSKEGGKMVVLKKV